MSMHHQLGGKCEAGLGNYLPSPGPRHHIYVLQPHAGENHIAGATFNSKTFNFIAQMHGAYSFLKS